MRSFMLIVVLCLGLLLGFMFAGGFKTVVEVEKAKKRDEHCRKIEDYIDYWLAPWNCPVPPDDDYERGRR